MEVIESNDLERNLEATSPISLFKFKNPLQQFPKRQTSNLDLKTYNIYIVYSIWGQFQLPFFFLLRQYLHLCNICQLTLYLPLVLQSMTLISFVLDIFYFLLCTNLKNTYVCMYVSNAYIFAYTYIFPPQQCTIPRILLQVYS